jgi:hypothetical protein
MCGEQGNERIELARGGGKPVQQHQRRRVFRARFPMEDPDAINRHAVIGRCSRRGLQRSGLRSITAVVEFDLQGADKFSGAALEVCSGQGNGASE